MKIPLYESDYVRIKKEKEIDFKALEERAREYAKVSAVAFCDAVAGDCTLFIDHCRMLNTALVWDAKRLPFAATIVSTDNRMAIPSQLIRNLQSATLNKKNNLVVGHLQQ